jgi:hypothetical protein
VLYYNRATKRGQQSSPQFPFPCPASSCCFSILNTRFSKPTTRCNLHGHNATKVEESVPVVCMILMLLQLDTAQPCCQTLLVVIQLDWC